MQWDRDGMLLVRAELSERLDALQQAAARMTVRDFVRDLGAIRTLAGAYGMLPVVCLADAFERAIRSEPRGCPAGLYFDRLRDAIGCAPLDAVASETLMASISVRLGA
jgi:hypothetical protein